MDKSKLIFQYSVKDFIKLTGQQDVFAADIKAKLLYDRYGFDLNFQERLRTLVKETALFAIEHTLESFIAFNIILDDNRVGFCTTLKILNASLINSEITISNIRYRKPININIDKIRFMFDELKIDKLFDSGEVTLIQGVKWADSITEAKNSYPLDIGVINIAKPGEEYNGDTFFINNSKSFTLVAIIDGLGHGKLAHQAAVLARNYIADNLEQSLPMLFNGVDSKVRSTNGLVMALAKFDWQTATVSFASIGNIEAKVLGPHKNQHLYANRGMVGRDMPAPKQVQLDWTKDSVLVLHTDGLTSRWQWNQFNQRPYESAQTIAEIMHQKLWSLRDDATIIVVKNL